MSLRSRFDRSAEVSATIAASRRGRTPAIAWIALACLLVAALVVRILPVGTEYPYSYYVDEGHVIGRSAVMLRSGDLDPHWFRWPTFLIYLHALTFRLLRPVAGPLLHSGSCADMDPFYGPVTSYQLYYNIVCPASLLIVGRILTALFGVATILLVFQVARHTRDLATAFSAATILAVIPGHVEFSRYITGDVPATFFAIATLYCSTLLFERDRARDGLLAGLCIGLAIASKYTMGLLLLMPVTALALLGELRMRVWRRLLWIPVVAGVTFSILNPYHLVRPAEASRSMLSEVTYYYQDRFANSPTRSACEWLDNFLSPRKVGAAIVVSALLGLALAFRRGKRGLFIPLPFVVALAIPLASAPIQPLRNFLPMIAILAIWAGYALGSAPELLGLGGSRRAWPRPLVTAALTVLCTGAAALAVVHQTRDMLHMPNSRRELVDWLSENGNAARQILIDPRLQLHPSELARLHSHGVDFELAALDPPGTSTPAWYVAGRFVSCPPERPACLDHNRMLSDLSAIVRFGSEEIPFGTNYWIGREPAIGVYAMGPPTR